MANVSIDNRTENPMKFQTKKDWHGKPKDPYPTTIPNGNVTEFPNIKDGSGYAAAVVYRGKIRNQFYDYMMAWSNLTSPDHVNSVWAEIHEADYFTDAVLEKIHEKLADPRNNSHDDTGNGVNGCELTVTITNDNSAKVQATITLKADNDP